MVEVNFPGTVSQQNIPTLRDWSKVLQLSETKDYLDNLEKGLRQQYYDDTKREWCSKPGIPPLMNEIGIHKVMTSVKNVIHRVMGQGNFDQKKEMYYRVFCEIWEGVNDDIFANEDVYEITQNDIAYIKRLIIIPTEIYLTRLLSDKERSYIYGEEKSTSWQKYFMPKAKGEKSSEVYGG